MSIRCILTSFYKPQDVYRSFEKLDMKKIQSSDILIITPSMIKYPLLLATQATFLFDAQW